MRTSIRLFVASCLTIGVAACTVLSDGGANLGSQVAARGKVVAFTWDPKHPLDSQLRSSPLRLQADYVDTSGRRHSETLATARSAPDKREMDFTLPTVLNSPPRSEVCLYFLPANDRRALPIRSVAAAGTHDTAGFTYTEWADTTVAPSTQRELERKLQQASSETTELMSDLQSITLAAGKQKAHDVAGCDGLPMPQKAERPPDVIDPDDQEVATHRLCIRRARNSRNLPRQYRVDLPTYAIREIQSPSNTAKVAPEAYAARLAQAKAFLADWNTYEKQVGAEYNAPLGDGHEELPVGAETDNITTSVAAKVEEQLNEKGISPSAPEASAELDRALENLPPAQRYALLAGGLEAWSGCLADSQKQLQSKYEAWQFAEQRSPVRIKQTHDYDVRQCKLAFTRLATATEAARAAESRQQEIKSQLDAARAAAPAPLPVEDVSLSGRMCGK